MRNLISVSTAPIARLGNKKYYDLQGTIGVLRQVFRKSVVDGFELQLQPEWDSEKAPLTDTELADWTKTPKYSNETILQMLKNEKLPILSVHASRDIGNYLTSNQKQDVEKGRRLIRDSLAFTDAIGAEICVFHLWGTWKTNFDFDNLKKIFLATTRQFPSLKSCVENIPTHLCGCTPFSLVRHFEWATLDLRWASMYDELESFKSIVDRIANVHLRGRLERGKWTLTDGMFGFYEALDRIRTEWEYRGVLTVEPEGGLGPSSFDSFVQAMKSIRDE